MNSRALPSSCSTLWALACAAMLVASCGRDSRDASAGGVPQPPEGATGTTGVAGRPVAPVPPGETAAAAGTVDPAVVQRLETMRAYLRGLPTFQVQAVTTRDEVLRDGQLVQFDGAVDILVQQPNRLRAEVTDARDQRFFFADGTTFTLWARRPNYYVSIPASGPLTNLHDRLSGEFGVDLPLVDLLHWGDQRRGSFEGLTSAIDLGVSQVEGISATHYALRQDGVDWQIWVQLGQYPLPLKVVITTTSDPAHPQYRSVLAWNLAPSFNDGTFRFAPPDGARAIAFARPDDDAGRSRP